MFLGTSEENSELRKEDNENQKTGGNEPVQSTGVNKSEVNPWIRVASY